MILLISSSYENKGLILSLTKYEPYKDATEEEDSSEKIKSARVLILIFSISFFVTFPFFTSLMIFKISFSTSFALTPSLQTATNINTPGSFSSIL